MRIAHRRRVQKCRRCRRPFLPKAQRLQLNNRSGVHPCHMFSSVWPCFSDTFSGKLENPDNLKRQPQNYHHAVLPERRLQNSNRTTRSHPFHSSRSIVGWITGRGSWPGISVRCQSQTIRHLLSDVAIQREVPQSHTHRALRRGRESLFCPGVRQEQ